MSYQLNAGVQLSVDYDPIGKTGNWYSITDDNRQPIKIGYEVIEKTNRMADGTLRRYVVARKHKITSSWQMTWSSSAMTSDNKKGGAWLRSFYEANVFIPIYVRLTVASVGTQNINTTTGFIPGIQGVESPSGYYHSSNRDTYVPYSYSSSDTYVPSYVANQSTNMIYNVFITSFDYSVNKRNKSYDFVDISIEFTEI
jgi:hypothetical protein